MRLLPLFLLGLSLGACAESEAAQPGGQAVPVGVVEVLVRDVALWDDFTGRVESPHDVTIQPRVSGYVESIPRKFEGAEVKAGQVLFVIDPRQFRAELAQARANVERAKSQLTLALAEARRAEKLYREEVIALDVHDARTSAAAQAKADLRAAEALRDVAELNLGFTEVRAPLDGRIGRSLVSVGDFVSGGSTPTALTTLVSQDPVYVYFESDERTFLRYDDQARSGQGPNARRENLTALVARATDENFPFRGQVNFVDNRVTPSTGTIRLRAILPNADRALLPGLFVRVRLQGRGTTRSLLVDEKSVQTDQDRKYVYVAQEGRAVRKDVKLGRTVGRFRIVEDGLHEGDRVVLEGVQRVRADAPVAPRLIPVSNEPPGPSR